MASIARHFPTEVESTDEQDPEDVSIDLRLFWSGRKNWAISNWKFPQTRRPKASATHRKIAVSIPAIGVTFRMHSALVYFHSSNLLLSTSQIKD